MKFSVRLLYLYLFSFIGLIIAVIGSIHLVDLALKVYIFKGADRYESYPMRAKLNPDGTETQLTPEQIEEQNRINDLENNRQRQRQVSGALSMLIIGLPLYKYHWGKIQEEKNK